MVTEMEPDTDMKELESEIWIPVSAVWLLLLFCVVAGGICAVLLGSLGL